MISAMRTIVDLPNEQIKELSDFCKKEHISRAEAIRRAVKKLLSDTFQGKMIQDIAFGIWKDKYPDGRKYVEKLRTEWDKE